MKTIKKSDVGHVEASTQLNGEYRKTSNDSNVRIAISFLPLRTSLYGIPIGLYGLKSGSQEEVRSPNFQRNLPVQQVR